MNFWLLFIVFFIILIVSYLIKNKLVIHFGTLFRKGFKKSKDTYGIYTFVGFQGDGKTYSCVDFIDKIRGDKKVITNVYSYFNNNKDFCIYETNIYNIINNFKKGLYKRGTVIFYDELFTMLQKGKIDRRVLSFISQFRKRGIYFLTTAQEWLDIDITFRRRSRYVVYCNMINFLKLGPAFSINQIQDGYKIKWSKEDNEYIAPIIKTTIKKCSKALADSYDTLEVIDDLD